LKTDKYKKGYEGDENYHVRLLDLDNESVFFLIQNHEKQIPIDLKDFIKELQLTHRVYQYGRLDELRFEFVSGRGWEFILFFEYL